MTNVLGHESFREKEQQQRQSKQWQKQNTDANESEVELGGNILSNLAFLRVLISHCWDNFIKPSELTTESNPIIAFPC